MALHETDLLFVFGARLDDRVTGEPTRFAPHAKIVHFEIDPAQLDRVRSCDSADRKSGRDDSGVSRRVAPAQAFPILLTGVQLLVDRSAPNWIRAVWRSRRFAFWMNSSPSACLPKTMWFSPMWANTRWWRRSVIVLLRREVHHFRRAGRDGLRSSRLARVQLARPDACGALRFGDGGFQMNIQEFGNC